MPPKASTANTKTTSHLQMPTKSDGSRDKRYNMPQFTKNDGTRDMRTSASSSKKWFSEITVNFSLIFVVNMCMRSHSSNPKYQISICNVSLHFKFVLHVNISLLYTLVLIIAHNLWDEQERDRSDKKVSVVSRYYIVCINVNALVRENFKILIER